MAVRGRRTASTTGSKAGHDLIGGFPAHGNSQ
eukprot:CAMPEP_0204466990 /NCGR_PEP_ID=MMETSP0471-20130131/9494_1 /ASSEMBLY_ACC=CAM_ASM_000602 /TAXON_ID=2969 /ORGANISM="Oxyrrhis marina" /LENGTH=31 /DNA_ID= /DNA_START= /DNA_END= /DNA_ORIENTATION=